MHHFGGGDAFFQNRFSAGIVVIGHREHHGGAVIHGNGFLLGGQTEGTLADHVTAMIGEKGGGEHFGGARSGCIGQHRNWVFPDDFVRLRRKHLRRHRLSTQGRQRATRNKQPRHRDAFRNRTATALAQIQNQLVNSLLIGVDQPRTHFLRASSVQ